MPIYEHTTRAEFKEKIRQKLGEGGIFWPDSELNQSIEEALLTFGAISGFWKENIKLVTSENKRVYDIFSDVTEGNDYIEPSLNYQKIIDWLNKDLIENISVADPNTEFLSLDGFIKAIETKYNLYQQLTNLVISTVDINAPAQQEVIELPKNIIDIIRVTYIRDNEEYVLDEADETELQYFASDSLGSFDIPNFYANTYDDTKSIRLYPTQANTGTLRIVFVGARDNTVPADVDTLLNLPNNLVPYIKYGIEADIFGKTGVLNDPERAAYCKQRWEEGLIVGRNFTSALIALANGVVINLDSVNNIDNFGNANKVRTPPTVLGFAGFNIFITDITPSAAVASINLWIVANAKIPQNDADFIKIDIEYIDMLADYVIHLSMFKCGVAELASTNNLKENFIKTSIGHNKRLSSKGVTFENLAGMTKKQEKEQQRIPE